MTGAVLAAAACASLAGSYSAGDGFVSQRIVVAPDCGVRISYGSDAGDSWEENGPGALSGGVLQLPAQAEKPVHQHPTRFVLVPWKPRAFLVAEEKLVTFCNAVNAGAEPSRVWWIVSKDGVRETRPEGLPEVPGEARKLLLSSPLRGSVVKVERPEIVETVKNGDCEERRKTQSASVRVSLGARDGLLKGMLLFASNPRRPSLDADLRVTEVAEAESFAEVRSLPC